ncbi:MAG TPA: lysine--tRNA ligase [Patescibacteria group bacterium]|nr:lysine--tRNA ligase [Patescibacteria group bacterium]
MEEDYIKTRKSKIENLRSLGVDPYPARFVRTHTSVQALKLKDGTKKVRLAGRLVLIRDMGRLTFAHILDGEGKIQIAFNEKDIGKDKYKFFNKNFDLGDFIGVDGKMFKTHKGEKTLLVNKFEMLTKALRPLPDKWHGISDEEEKLRRRYLDIMMNPEVKDMIKKRSVFWNSIREFLLKKDFIEVETPVLETTTGGADARPFQTHHNALDMDVYLRISMGELWQKRLMVGGLEKTFEIGRQFRNEGMSPEHLQDYTQVEFYMAYSDYTDGMKFVEELYKYVIKKTFGTLKFDIRGFKVDFSKKWEVYDYVKTIKKMTGIDVLNTNLKQIESKLKELKIDYEKKGFNITRAIDNLWKYCRKKIAGPGFLINPPVTMEPLAKRSKENPELVQRFQVLIAGSEVGKGYSELNDPTDQAMRFAEQQKLRESGDEEAQMADYDFVEALEYGMPPTFGFGVSERLFGFLMNKTAREAQIFPLMKPRE